MASKQQSTEGSKMKKYIDWALEEMRHDTWMGVTLVVTWVLLGLLLVPIFGLFLLIILVISPRVMLGVLVMALVFPTIYSAFVYHRRYNK